MADYESVLAGVWGTNFLDKYVIPINDILKETSSDFECIKGSTYPELFNMYIKLKNNIVNIRLICYIEFNKFLVNRYRFRWIIDAGKSVKHNATVSLSTIMMNRYKVQWAYIQRISIYLMSAITSEKRLVVCPDKTYNILLSYIYGSPLRYNFVRKFKTIYYATMKKGYYQPDQLPQLFTITINDMNMVFGVVIDKNTLVMAPYMIIGNNVSMLDDKFDFESAIDRKMILPYLDINELFQEYIAVFDRWNSK